MPFKSEKEVADRVKGTDELSERKRRQFMHVVNDCIEEHGDDASCYQKSWGVVKNTASQKIAKELLVIAKEVLSADVPEWH